MGKYQKFKRSWKYPTYTNDTERRSRNEDTPVKVNCGDSSPSDVINMFSDNMQVNELPPSDFEHRGGEICDLKREISTLREKVQTLEQENIYVRKQVESEQNKPSNISRMETIIKELKQEINDKDQKALFNDIEIIGIPEVSGETPLHIMSTVANKMGVILNDHDSICGACRSPFE
ncbi:unnamed protein product [Parnassius apollo]|uniref:(apollo) hypothetical protein n=1 Tax=Parnassius apollo TaxID=110799 RepID=A0A8S3Y3W5_PARAO|nr:unnamed protein product [Parnassius apollo]